MIRETINNLIAIAMKEHNQERLDTLRLIKNQLLVLEKSGQEYTEQAELKTLMKMVSSHEDSIKQFNSAGRNDLAEKELKELEIIKEFIPEQPSDEDIEKYTSIVVSQYLSDNSLSMSDLNMKHMKPIMTIVKEKYDTPTVGKIVSQCIQKIIKN